MNEQYSLRLTLHAPHGEKSYSVAIPIDAFDALDRYVGLTPPSAFDLELGAVSLDAVVKRMRVREYRKDDFEAYARQLARTLGERMEDEEGWHGVERQSLYEEMRRDGRS